MKHPLGVEVFTSNSERLYNVHLYHVDPKTGVKTGGYNHGVKMNKTPMSHKEACHFKWAVDMYHKGISYELVEVTPN